MVFESIIGIIIALIIIYIIFKITKKIIWTIIIIIVLLIVFSGIFGFSIYSDFNDLREGLSNEDNIVFLSDNSKMLTGIILKGLDFEEEEPTTLSKEQIEKSTGFYEEKDYDALLGNNFKMMIVSLDFISENLNEEPFKDTEAGISLNKNQVIEILSSEEKLNEFYSLNEMEGIDNPYELRAFLFLFSMATITSEEKGFTLLLREYKKDKITIYPNSILLKIVKKIPLKTAEKVLEEN